MTRAEDWLAISLWDFSWVTQSGAGGPFEDLDRAFEELVARGFNTVRVCAMPLLLFDAGGRPRESLEMVPWPDPLGRRTRWQNQAVPASIEPAQHLRALFGGALRARCRVIVSSWEYFQTASFLAQREDAARLFDVPAPERFMHLARGMDRLLAFLGEEDLLGAVAYVELHNEVNLSRLADVAAEDPFVETKPYLEEALGYLQDRHPDLVFTVAYTEFPLDRLDALPDNLQVLNQHLYDWTLVDRYEELTGIAEGVYPNRFARSLWRSDAAPFETYRWPADEAWRQNATVAAELDFLHLHDACDADRFDAWLSSAWGEYRRAILRATSLKLDAFAQEARRRGVPCVVGEGWLGWWPSNSRFELGAPAREAMVAATTHAEELGYWGTVLSSNFAPHHPEWHELVDWQRERNDALVAARREHHLKGPQR